LRAFTCAHCASLVFFENSVCVTCGSALGYVRERGELMVLTPGPAGLSYTGPKGSPLRPCRNLAVAGCNWLAAAGAPDGLCTCCQLTRTRPADNDKVGMAEFARTEKAKRRLVFQLDSLGLPTTSRIDDPEQGLAFDLLSSVGHPVTTGHNRGVITIDLAEGDDPHREALRVSLDEPYRTLLGHLRHEIGHWYWGSLVSGVSGVEGSSELDRFRGLFGDERADYTQALKAHYAEPAVAWQDEFVSAYASAHPWEDWAETFAHYLHIRDTLQTAAAYGVAVDGPDLRTRAAVRLDADPARQTGAFEDLIRTWLPLTYALNAVNRSMGRDDLYPFVLPPRALDKLRFVHDRIVPWPHR
jgi:hypothetical protein